VKKLGDEVEITGDDNITTGANPNGVQVKLNKALNVDSVTAGDTKIDTNGLKAGEIKESEYENILYFHEKLSSQIDKIEFDCLDLLRDSLLASLTCIEIMGLLHYFKRAVETLNKIGQKTRDFQKQPIVLMLEWKYYIQTDYETAKQKYEEAKMMARMFGNEKLIVSLDNEWAEDLERYR